MCWHSPGDEEQCCTGAGNTAVLQWRGAQEMNHKVPVKSSQLTPPQEGAALGGVLMEIVPRASLAGTAGELFPGKGFLATLDISKHRCS